MSLGALEVGIGQYGISGGDAEIVGQLFARKIIFCIPGLIFLILVRGVMSSNLVPNTDKQCALFPRRHLLPPHENVY